MKLPCLNLSVLVMEYSEEAFDTGVVFGGGGRGGALEWNDC
jgi:hypothetical protein